MNVLNGDLVGVLLPGNWESHVQSDLPWRGLPPAPPPPAEPALVAHHESLARPATIPRARFAATEQKANSSIIISFELFSFFPEPSPQKGPSVR